LRWRTAKKVLSLRSVTTNLEHLGLERLEDVLDQIVRHRPGGRIFLELSAMALASKDADPDRSERLSSSSRRMMIGMFETGSRASRALSSRRAYGLLGH